ncbi:MAG: general secretion pathway protein GspB, partial [Pseudomonadota bacterium]|nr:general secretion pathway protein GspB [Pseudomonadota bacterium]
AKPSATAEKVYAVAELPEDIRSQLPVLAVGGSMYSSKPADRLLILNGQVVHEGDKIGNDLVLQQIRLKSALLSFKGYRYTMNF